MRLKLVAVLFIFLCCINTASAAMPYFIDADTNGYTWINDSIVAGVNNTYKITKANGYAPNGSNVFESFTNCNTLDDFSTVGTPTIIDNSVYIDGSPETIEFEWEGVTKTKVMMRIKWTSTGGTNWVHYRFYGADRTPASPSVFAATSGSSSADGYAYWSSGAYHKITGDTVNTWHTVEYDIDCDTDTSNIFFDYSQVATNAGFYATDTEVSGVNIGRTTSDDVNPTYIDYIAVAQYADEEPTVVVNDMGSYYEVIVSSTENLTAYQIAIPCTDLDISSSTESLLIQKIQDPYVIVSLDSPVNDSYTNSNTLYFSVSGVGEFNASVYIDDEYIWDGSVLEGINQYNATLSQGLHSWSINASAVYLGNTSYNISDTWFFTYDTINPAISSTSINPDYENIANGTIVQTNIKWSDSNLKNASLYVNYGEGYNLEDSITFSTSMGWFNTSISTTGYVGETISWYQIAYDTAGNSYTYSDSFNVVLNALNIYVYDETSGEQILPSSVVIYNEDISQNAIISESTSIASLGYTNITTSKYIIRVVADGYYSRQSLLYVDIESLAELNVFLPSENETVIYDTFKITDNTMQYDYNELEIRLDKPMSDGTETVYSSYFDFAGSTAAYLIATDQYLLYITTPSQTITYGWLTPDADGQIDISLNGITVDPYYDDWYSYNYSVSNGVVSLDYSSTDSLSCATFIIENTSSELYNVTSFTDAGSFNCVINSNESLNVYFELVRGDGATVTDFWTIIGSEAEKNVFPASYPQWLKNTVVTALAILCIIGFSSYRVEVGMALGVGIIGLAYIWGEYQINDNTGYTVALLAFITIITFVIQQRKEASR